MPKQLLFSLTAKDFDVSYFAVGGAGGGGKDTSNSGVRIIHRASGAQATGKESRSAQKNRASAFNRLVETPVFKRWHAAECARRLGRVDPSLVETPAMIRERVARQLEVDAASGLVLVEEF